MINQKVLVQLKDNYQPGILVAKDKVQLDDGQIVLTNSIIDNTIPNTNIHQIIYQLLNNKSININDCLFLMLNNSAIQFQFNCNESYCFQISNSNILSFNHLIEQIHHKQSKLLQSLIILNELFKFNSNDNNLITIFNNNCFKYKYFNISNRIFAKNFKFPILNLFYNQLTNENNNYITNSNTQTQYQCPFQQIEEYNNYILQDLLKSINQISIFQVLSKLFSSILLLQIIKFDQLQQQSDLINKIESNLDLSAQSLLTELTIKKRKMGNKFIEQQMNQQEMEIIKDQISTFLYYLARQITFNTNQVDNNDNQTFINLLFYSTFNTIQTNLESLIENYSIEKLNYQFYNRIKIERERDLKGLQIQFAQINLTTNLQIIELFDKKTVGLIGLIEEHTLNNTDEGKLIEKIKSLQRTYVKQMKIQPQNPQLFTINHSYGQINYSVAEFKVQNKFESLSKVAEFIQSSKDQVISLNAQTLNVQYKTNIEQYQNYMTKINDEQEKCNQIMVYQMKNSNYQDILKQLEQYNIPNYLSYYYQIYPYRYEIQDFVDTINQIYFVPPQFTLQEKLAYCQKKIYQIDHLVCANNLLFLTLEQQLKIETINDNCVNKFINFKNLLKKNYRSYILRKKLKPKIRKIKIMNAIVQLQQAILKTGAILQWNHMIQDIQFIQYSSRKYLQKQAFKKQMFARSILRSVIDQVWVKVENLMAVKLQKIFRGNKIRSQNNEIISQVKQKMIEFIRLKKTIFIQKNIRKYLCRKHYKQQLNKIISNILQSQWRMLKSRKNYLKIKNQIIFIQRQFKPIILKSLVRHKEFLNFEKKQKIQFNEFLKNNNKNLLDYEKLLNQQFDDQKIRIFQIILNLEFLVDLSDVCFCWLQNYSLYWSKCFHKNKPIQFLEVSETQTFAVDAVGKVYQWGLVDEILVKSNVKYFQAGENLAIYQNDMLILLIFFTFCKSCKQIISKAMQVMKTSNTKPSECKWNCLSLDEKQTKQNNISNYSSMYIKSNHMFGYKDNCIDSFIYSTNQALKNSTLEFKKPIDQISCGHNFILYLTKGQLWSVGSNKYGQLGLGDYNDRNTPSQAQIENVIWIECGQTHAVLKTFKKCFGVGNNKYGQLGLPKKCYNSPQCLIYPMNENIQSLSASYRGTLFLSESNKIFMTGQCNNFKSNKFIQYIDYHFLNKQHYIPIKIQCSWSKTVSIINCRFIFENLYKILHLIQIQCKHCKKEQEHTSIYIIILKSFTKLSIISLSIFIIDPPKCEFVQQYCLQIYNKIQHIDQKVSGKNGQEQKSVKFERKNIDQIKQQILALQNKPKNKWNIEDHRFLETVNMLNILNQII